MNFQNWFVVLYFRWFFQRIQRINEINETNSTNQRIKFSLILQNFNEFSTKNSRNQRKFSKNLRIHWKFVNDAFLKVLFERLKFLLKICQHFYKSTKILSVDSLNSLMDFQINIYSLISFFKSTNSTKSIFFFQRKRINE